MAPDDKTLKIAETRAKPTQQRSIATYEKILAASISILSEEGAGALNTNAIATRAGVNVGSVYHYFDDKWAIVQVLMERMLSRGLGVINSYVISLVQTDDTFTWSRNLLTDVHRMRLNHPGTAQLRALCRTVPELEKLNLEVEAIVREHITDSIAQRLPGMPPERRLHAAYTIQQIGALWLDRALAFETEFEPRLDEMALMLSSYLNTLDAEYL